MIRMLLSLIYLIPMSAQDIIDRKVSLSLSIPLILLSFFFSLEYGMWEVSIICSQLLFLLFFLTHENQNFIGGADILTICSLFFFFTVPITAIIVLLATGLSFIWIYKTKDKNVPFVFMLTLAMVFVDLFNGN